MNNDQLLVQAMVDQVLASVEGPITEEDIEQIRKNVRDYVEEAEAMRQIPLTNADEPDFVFQAYREEVGES